jgi:Holliday junction resolvase RusA-like endonuclease
MRIAFSVLGKPQPQGSTRAFMPKGARFPVVTSDNKNLKPWRQDVAITAQLQMVKGAYPVQQGPIRMVCRCYFQRPKSVKASVVHKTTKPDADKLARSFGDALTGIVYRDDSQIVSLTIEKLFGTPERAEIEIELAA